MKALVTFIFTLVTLHVFATAQQPDKIIYKGKAYALHTNPLEAYFERYPAQRPSSGLMSTALWRGYIATFEVKDDQLFVKDIEVRVLKDTASRSFDTEWKSVLAEVFPGQKEVKVDWLTGLLVLPYGKLVNYVHMGYGSTYKNYILLEIDRGDFKKEKRFGYKEYEQFKEKQFQVFKQSDEYRKIKEELLKEGSSDELIDSFLRSFITDYTSRILTD